jgi:hypothetical protein
MTRWITSRKVASLLVLGSSTFLQFSGKLGADAYALTCIAVIAGHHAPEILRAWKGGPSA